MGANLGGRDELAGAAPERRADPVGRRMTRLMGLWAVFGVILGALGPEFGGPGVGGAAGALAGALVFIPLGGLLGLLGGSGSGTVVGAIGGCVVGLLGGLPGPGVAAVAGALVGSTLRPYLGFLLRMSGLVRFLGLRLRVAWPASGTVRRGGLAAGQAGRSLTTNDW